MNELDGIRYVLYQAIMLYGIGSLVSVFLWGGTREVSEGLWLVLGVAIPIASWLFSTFAAESTIIMPAGLGILFVLLLFRGLIDGAAQRSLWRQEHRSAEQLIDQDPKNAAAYWAKARTYEAQGSYSRALENFERAHKLSERTVSSMEMEDIRDRLEHQMSQRRRFFISGPLRLLKKALSLEAILFVVGLSFSQWSVVSSINICSLMLFNLWFRSRERHA
ncbi:MAG: tetratricopeptide repeat protein [Elusimicrobia bacterium]|nr:tetratricopeptide repeat protein [Elusimicrobiota bacterium]